MSEICKRESRPLKTVRCELRRLLANGVFATQLSRPSEMLEAFRMGEDLSLPHGFRSLRGEITKAD
jgi:hypothetical protein